MKMRILWAIAMLMSLAGAQKCAEQPILKVKLSGPLKFIAIGDWGRLGATKSITPVDKGGFDKTGYCASLFASMYEEDVRGGISQLSVAASLNANARSIKPHFVVNLGDNFYECGVDTPLRLDMDWNRVYGSKCTTPNIASLPWYNIIGNHDIFNKSVDVQLDYAKFEPRWIMPCRYYAVDYEVALTNKQTMTVRLVYINNTPWVSYYNTSSSGFKTEEQATTSQPSEISTQLQWLERTLNSSKARWNIIVGHQPMVTSSPWGYGPFTRYFNGPGEILDPGMPDAHGQRSYNMLYELIKKYKVDAYINGHDHINAHMVDPLDPEKHKTNYITTGAGSASDPINGCGYGTRPFVKWVGAVLGKNQTCANPSGVAYPGYVAFKLDYKYLKVNYYVLPDYHSPETQQPYSINVNKA